MSGLLSRLASVASMSGDGLGLGPLGLNLAGADCLPSAGSGAPPSDPPTPLQSPLGGSAGSGGFVPHGQAAGPRGSVASVSSTTSSSGQSVCANIPGSPSMYGRIRSWILADTPDQPETCRGEPVTRKVGRTK